MDTLTLLFLILLGVLLLFGIPLLLAFFIYRWLVKKGQKKIALIISSLIIATLLFFVYTAINPLDSFYKDDFEKETEVKFPTSGKFLSKAASFPDHHGKYYSDAVIKFSKKDYSDLFEKAMSFTTDSVIGDDSNYFEEVTKGISKKEIVRIVKRKKIKIAFLNDGERIILERCMYNNYIIDEN